MTDPKAPKNNSSNNFLLPTNGSMLAPTIPTPQKLNSGSATGNPRNKCALKPGHSLMDWIRLGNTPGVDLADTRGRVIPVSIEELAKHNTRDDAWMAIRGMVYNVTRYMDFHPGGIDELKRGIGRDATKLFDEVHAWVNYQQLLSKCYIGPLRTVVKLDADILKSLQDKAKADTDNLMKPPTNLSTEVRPRFDWIQKRADITFYIYTKQFCNPGLIVQRKNGKELQLRVQIEHVTNVFDLELQQSIDWPPKSAKIASDTGKIEVQFSKSNAELWTNYGAHSTRKIMQHDEEELQYEFQIVESHDFNHDSFEICLRGERDTLMILPIGFHVTVTAFINGDMVRRSYTPVPASYLHKKILEQSANSIANLNYLIKNYTTGTLTPHIKQLQISDALMLSPPKGNFKLQQLLQHRRIALLAAGSGLTPFLGLIEPLLKRTTNRLEHLQLMYFNKTESDIWCRTNLEALQIADERFNFVNILSQAGDDWHGLTGRISKEMLSPFTNKNAPEYVTFVGVCGPRDFNRHTEEILKDLQFTTENIHIFQG